MILTLVFGAVFLLMALEAWLARRHERTLRAAGAVEPSRDVYSVMKFAYPACFLGMTGEAWLRGAEVDRTFAAGFLLLALAKALKYWAIATLGVRWTFRVLVPPGSLPIAAGPYAVIRHPNYVAVVGELIGVGLMARAPVTGLLSVLGFGALMAARIRVEERALAAPPE